MNFIKNLYRRFFGKTTRLEIYEEALHQLESAPDDYTIGLCWLLSTAKRCLQHRKHERTSHSWLSDYPEIMAHKPKVMFNDSYWFHPYDKETRRRILTTIINTMKENTNI